MRLRQFNEILRGAHIADVPGKALSGVGSHKSLT